MKIGRIKIWKLLGVAAVVAATATLLSSAGTAAENQSVTLVWWHNVTARRTCSRAGAVADSLTSRKPARSRT